MSVKFAIFLDIDGTLTWDGTGLTSEGNLRVLQRAQKEGHLVCINSGRSYGNLQMQLIEQIKPNGIVCGGGAYVTLSGEILSAVRMSKELVMTICETFLKEHISLVLEAEGNSAIVCPDIYPWESHNFAAISNMEEAKAYSDSADVTKITITALRREMPEYVIDLLNEHFSVIYHPGYTEAILKPCSKATGMQVLMNAAGIDREHTMGLGDSLNDEEMLRFAGISVAMGQAPDEVKAFATVVTAPADEDGVAKAIEQYILNA